MRLTNSQWLQAVNVELRRLDPTAPRLDPALRAIFDEIIERALETEINPGDLSVLIGWLDELDDDPDFEDEPWEPDSGEEDELFPRWAQ
jgi:hypothetical protein